MTCGKKQLVLGEKLSIWEEPCRPETSPKNRTQDHQTTSKTPLNIPTVIKDQGQLLVRWCFGFITGQMLRSWCRYYTAVELRGVKEDPQVTTETLSSCWQVQPSQEKPRVLRLIDTATGPTRRPGCRRHPTVPSGPLLVLFPPWAPLLSQTPRKSQPLFTRPRAKTSSAGQRKGRP